MGYLLSPAGDSWLALFVRWLVDDADAAVFGSFADVAMWRVCHGVRVGWQRPRGWSSMLWYGGLLMMAKERGRVPILNGKW